jgi:DNA-binding winged helix-turn-helix (wHTH) protein
MRASGVQQTHIPSELTSLGDAISFGPFLLFRTERLLEESGVPVHVGSRAMDILITLTEKAGQVVDRRELMARALAQSGG